MFKRTNNAINQNNKKKGLKEVSDINVLLTRLLSLSNESEITFNQVYFILFGSMPDNIVEVIESLDSIKTMINKDIYDSILYLYEKEHLINVARVPNISTNSHL